MLALQRAAGNRAVSELLARDAKKDMKDEPKVEERASTMTLGLGDLGVIPLDSVSSSSGTEIGVVFVNNPLIPKLLEAAAKGTKFPSAFLSTMGMMAKMTDVYISNLQLSGSAGGGLEFASMTLSFKTMVPEPVK